MAIENGLNSEDILHEEVKAGKQAEHFAFAQTSAEHQEPGSRDMAKTFRTLYYEATDFFKNLPEEHKQALSHSVKGSLRKAAAVLGLLLSPEMAAAQHFQDAQVADPEKTEFTMGTSKGGGEHGRNISFARGFRAGDLRFELSGGARYLDSVFVPETKYNDKMTEPPVQQKFKGIPRYDNLEAGIKVPMKEGESFRLSALSEIGQHEGGTAWFFGAAADAKLPDKFKFPKGSEVYMNGGVYADLTSKPGETVATPGYSAKMGLKAKLSELPFLSNFSGLFPSGVVYAEYGLSGKGKGGIAFGLKFGK